MAYIPNLPIPRTGGLGGSPSVMGGGTGGGANPSFLSRASQFMQNPWLLAGLGGLGGLMAWRNAPSERDVAGQKMGFSMQQMMKIPGLAAAFRDFMIRGSGAQQSNLIGASNQFQQGLSRRLSETGLGGTGLAGMVGSMGQSMLGRSMADMYGGYNMAGFGMANQNVMQALQQALAGWQQPGTQDAILGALLGAGGRLSDRVLFPRA